MSLSGGLPLILALALLSHNTPYPGWAALLPTLGALLLISAGGSWFNRHVLSAGPVVFVGLISYPLYLWHWPLLTFALILREEEPSSLVRWAVVVVSFVLAWLTYRLVELPIRFGNTPLAVPILCVTMALIGVAGIVTVKYNGFRLRLPEPIRQLRDGAPNFDVDYRLHVCFLDLNEGYSYISLRM